MESQRNPPSVLATLMGLGEVVLQQTVKKQKSQRVLSENYLQRVSSIGRWEHRSFSKPRKLRAGTENRKHQNVLQLPEDQRKQNPERTGKQVRLGFISGDKGRGISNGDGLSNISRLGYSAATETRMGKISFHKYWWMDKSPTRSINLEKLRSRKCCSSYEVGVEVKNSFKWHSKETACQSSLFQISETSNSAHEKCSIRDLMLNLRNISRENTTISEPSIHDAAGSGEDLSFKNKTCVDLSQTPDISISSTGCVDLAAPLVVNKRSVFVHESAKTHKKDLLSFDFNWDAELADSSSCVSQVSNQQEDSTAEVSEESSIASYYSSVDHESLGNFDVCNSSPVSVLEASFEGGITSFSEWFANANPEMCDIKVNAKVLESSEAGSEWSDVIVSSDDEVEEEHTAHPGDNEMIKQFKIEESRDFCYMVDILIEAGFHEMGSWKWYCTDSPMNPYVFDMLEKKYGNQKCWRRSERRLLFDRVNFTLMKILQPWLGFRRLGGLQMEEEVWKLVADQEKEARTMGSPSEKALGTDDDWSLGNDVEEIAREMQYSLVEDLVSDFFRA